jgi:hypothetical protein
MAVHNESQFESLICGDLSAYGLLKAIPGSEGDSTGHDIALALYPADLIRWSAAC